MPDPVKGDLDKAVAGFRRSLLQKERGAASQMVRYYGEAWQRIRKEIVGLVAEYERLVRTGQDSQAALLQIRRMREIKSQVEKELAKFARYAGNTIQRQEAEAIRAASRDALKMVQASFWPAPSVDMAFNRMSPSAIENMIAAFQAGSPVHDRLGMLAGEGAQAVQDGLTQGLMLGQNANTIARQIRLALGNSLAKALTWSRTETMRAYRGASLATYQANANVLGGWTWRSARNTRTCAMCWAMDGTVHELSEPLDDHPNGRCFAVPVPKSWEELGISGMPPARPPRMTGSEAFARLSEAEKLKVLGPAKYAAYKDGAIKLEDLVGRKFDPRWGSMRYERSLKEIVGIEDARKYYPASGQKVLGYTFYKPEIFGEISKVREVYQLGYSKQGWGYYEQVFRNQYLPRFKVRDDIEWTVGLWGSPEPSYNARLKGGYRNILRMAEKWGKDFNQDGMALLIPSKGGKGGVLSWDFGRELSLGEMDRLLDGLMAVNAKLKPGDLFEFIGLTVRGRTKIEFWVRNEVEKREGTVLIERALKKAKIDASGSPWRGGYNFVMLEKKNY